MRKSVWRILCMVLLAAFFVLAGQNQTYAAAAKETAVQTETAESDGKAEADSETAAEEDKKSEEKDKKQIRQDHEIPEGVSVNGIDLGGMSVQDAEERLEQYVNEVCDGVLTLTISDEAVKIPYKDFNMHVADSTIIQDICEIGTSGNLIKRYKELADVKNNKAEYKLPFEYNQDKLNELVDAGTAPYNRKAEDAVLVRHSGEFQITDEVTGIEVDLKATMGVINKALGEGWDGTSQKLPVTVKETKAVHTRKDLEVITDLLGSYSTSYSSSSSNRIANIANGAALIDETVIYPGETFSFLDEVTPFTYGNGYYDATGYSGGKVVPSLGGGICQVSSTLYNAVLRAELEVVERANHGLTVGYVPLGADATVAENSVDFKFKNNLESPVYIEAYTWDGYVYVCIYGDETRPSNRSIEFYSVTEETIAPGKDVVTEDNTQPEGWQEVTQSAHNGYVASFYKYVYVDGNLEDTIWLNTSRYSATPRYVTVGTKKKEPETEAQPDTSEEGSTDDASGEEGSGQEDNGE